MSLKLAERLAVTHIQTHRLKNGQYRISAAFGEHCFIKMFPTYEAMNAWLKERTGETTQRILRKTFKIENGPRKNATYYGRTETERLVG